MLSRVLRSPVTTSLTARALSSAPPAFTTPELTHEMAKGINDTVLFYAKHGIANQQMKKISSLTENTDAAHPVANLLVRKWQMMMEAHFSTQVSVLVRSSSSPLAHSSLF
jgi:maltoporin